MSHLRAIYHLRRVLALSHAATELDFYQNFETQFRGFYGDFIHTGGGTMMAAEWKSGEPMPQWNNDGPIFFEFTTVDSDGNEALVDFKLL